jgi:hypothetical protein
MEKRIKVACVCYEVSRVDQLLAHLEKQTVSPSTMRTKAIAIAV